MANVYGYVRVSTRDQNEDRQMIALQGVMMSTFRYRAEVYEKAKLL